MQIFDNMVAKYDLERIQKDVGLEVEEEYDAF